MISLCGDDCSSCPRYLATKSGRIDELEKVKDLWVRLGMRQPDFPVQDMACHGCRPETKCSYGELASCVRAKRIENCGFCDDYPCAIITNVFERTAKLQSLASRVCSQPEIGLLRKSFFSKKEYFDGVQRERGGKI